MPRRHSAHFAQARRVAGALGLLGSGSARILRARPTNGPAADPPDPATGTEQTMSKTIARMAVLGVAALVSACAPKPAQTVSVEQPVTTEPVLTGK